MSHLKLLSGALCSLLCLTSCNETPEFRISLTGIDATEDTLYVNVSLANPTNKVGGIQELTFDVRNRPDGAFTFGLTLDLSEDVASQGRKGTLDLMLASGGCIHRIFSAPLQNDSASTTALLSLTLNLSVPDSSDPPLRTIRMVTPKPGTTDTCYPVRRPTITALEREISGVYGSTTNKLVVYGWGLLSGTTVIGQLPTSAPATCPSSKDCRTPWNPLAMTSPFGDNASTVRLPLDTNALSKQLSPLIGVINMNLPSEYSGTLQFLSRDQTQNMAASVFPLQVTVTTPVGDTMQTDTYSEYHP